MNSFDSLVGRSPAYESLLRTAKLIAATDVTVLITGETGTGKELFARACHRASTRADQPFLALNCAALPEGLAQRPGDIDTVWLYGYGFPRQRGGPMFYADMVGLKEIYDVMSKLYDEHGEWLKPAPLLTELAAAGKSFGDL